MASHSSSTTLPCFFLLLLSLHFLLSIPTLSEARSQSQHRQLTHRRSLASFTEEEEEEEDNSSLPPPPPPKKKSTTTTTTAEGKNQTKLLKPTKPKKTNSTTTTTTSLFLKTHLNKTLTSTTKAPKPSNSTKLLKPSNSTKPVKPTKLLNSTKTPKSPKPLNSTTSIKLPKKPSDLPLPKTNKIQSNPTAKSKPNQQKQSKSETKSDSIKPWFEASDESSLVDGEDLISEFRDLPSRFHRTLLPDLEKITTTSKVYLSRANREITMGFKPFVGNRYAPAVASVTSALFLVLPLLLVTALFHQLRTYLSLPRMLLFIHAYLAIYFFILSLTAAVTGLEPLRLFYATSPGSYVYTQVLQTLGYVLYLLLQLMHLVVVFATSPSSSSSSREDGGGLGSKALGLGQVVVSLAVGLHYYAAVFHRAVSGEPPRTNWRVHGVYAACFLVICAFARAAERRKKAYLQAGGDDDCKKS